MSENRKPSSTLRHLFLPVMLGMALIFIAATFSAASAMPLFQADGATLFKEKGCSACHTIGGGTLVGPDLKGVTDLRTKEWLTNWISAPDKMIASGDPIATELLSTYKVPMPNLGLTPDEVAALITYLGGGATAAPSGPAAPALPAGDAVSGKAYFVGDKHFANGGPHCISCHSVAGLGSLGGGNLGPDLTTSGYVQSETAFATFISAPTTQTMNSVWKNTPLTPQEEADLYAFLSKASVTQREPSTLLQIALLAVAGTAILIALAQWHWSKRLKGVRKPMIARTLAKK